METAADQFAESLPIAMQPLPKAPAHGYSLVRPVNKDYALLYISGAGLKKGGTEPKAYSLMKTIPTITFFLTMELS